MGHIHNGLNRALYLFKHNSFSRIAKVSGTMILPMIFATAMITVFAIACLTSLICSIY